MSDIATGEMLEKISDLQMYACYETYLLQTDEYEDWEYDKKIYNTKNGIHTVTDKETGEDLGTVSNLQMRHIYRLERKSR